MNKTTDQIFFLPPEQIVPEATFAHSLNTDLTTRNSSQVDGAAKGKPEQEFPLSPSSSFISPGLQSQLGTLVRLISNITEAYTAAIFLANPTEKYLTIGAAHTLSRDFNLEVSIPYGCGLVGWTAEHGVRISVCPFEHDATTLQYYHKDQALKSFIAVPMIGRNGVLLGVISCDSKKSYAFPKITEKILLDCSSQTAALIDLYQQLGSSAKTKNRESQRQGLQAIVDQMRICKDEKSLFQIVTNIPLGIIERDALVVVTTDEASMKEGSANKGAFYSNVYRSNLNQQSFSNQKSSEEGIQSHYGAINQGAGSKNLAPSADLGQRLLDLVYRQKKILCGERTVHALPTEDKQRSFLSVPFQVLGQEAGSINLLSKPLQSFELSHILALEELVQEISRELERIRLRQRFASSVETTDILSWQQFSLKAPILLDENRQQRIAMTLLRFTLKNLLEIENQLGVAGTAQVLQKVMRLIEQVKRSPAVACYLYGFQILVLMETNEVERTIRRLKNLIERMTVDDLAIEARSSVSQGGKNLGRLILQGLEINSASYPKDGEKIDDLVTKTQKLLTQSLAKAVVWETPKEGVANVGNW